MRDENGQIIEEGSGKRHAHLVLRFPNPVWWSAIAKKLGFVLLGGEPDYQFIRALKYDDTRETYESFLVYLIHKNQPDKEQYDLRDLWGSPEMCQDAARAVLHYENRKIEMPDAVLECLRWISLQNKFISYTEFGFWACSNPWFKGASSPIVRAALDEHNAKYRRTANNEGE